MKCLYFMCEHSSISNSCNFIKIPSDDCAFKIWKRYANFDRDSIKSEVDARICSCHFDGSYRYPIPHYTKRTFTLADPNRKDEPKRKMPTGESKEYKMYRQTLKHQHAEIRLPTVKDLFAQNEQLFDVAVDAVVKGCVSKYHFDDETNKFIGTVTSLDGNEMYEVEIKVTEKLTIDAASCNCPERGICYHIGALALNSGYETPIFSYHSATHSDSSENSDSSDCAPQPLHEVYVKMETLDTIGSELEPIDALNIDSCPSNASYSTSKSFADI